jgi:Synergist-CTERM protein sorting domain-containing protein
VELHEGDVGPSNLIRAELGYHPPAATFQGSERWYAFSIRVETTPPLQNLDHQFTYWECDAPLYRQSMSFHLKGEDLTFQTSAQKGPNITPYKGKLVAGAWHDFVLHVKWSLDATQGFVELFYDGALVVPKTSVRTMYATQDGAGNDLMPLGSFIHQGLFLGAPVAGKPTEVLYVDGTVEATAKEDVFPAIADAGPDAVAPAGDAAPSSPTVDAGVSSSGGSSGAAAAPPQGEGDGGCNQGGAAPLALPLLLLLPLALRRRRSASSTAVHPTPPGGHGPRQ